MRMVELIEKKRDGKVLLSEEIQYIIKGVSEQTIPDYQISALLMAIYFKGLNEEETYELTKAMIESGGRIELGDTEKVVDKHSTGGVGDMTTLIVGPIVASCGGKVGKMSGRGLGHTGGTIDKLESIEGMRTELSMEEFKEILSDNSLVVGAATQDLIKADKILYALRDVTGTVPSIELIAASIMSKKIASGSQNIVLDVKCGSGAFMKTYDEAKKLAKAMVSIGKKLGKNVRAMITDMNEPLGRSVGNRLEILESIEVLKGERNESNLCKLCIELSANMLSIVLNESVDISRKRAKESIETGKAYKKYREFIEKQGGDFEAIEKAGFINSKYVVEVLSEKSGYVDEIETKEVGEAANILGAGRSKKGDKIDYSAGIVFEKRVGDRIEKGEVIAAIYTDKEAVIEEVKGRIVSSIKVSQKAREYGYDIVKEVVE